MGTFRTSGLQGLGDQITIPIETDEHGFGAREKLTTNARQKLTTSKEVNR